MKTAHFTYHEKNKKVLNGIITIKNDGKTSISILNSKHCAYNQRAAAKKLAHEIISVNFQHEAVTQFYEEDTSLVQVLKERTAELKQRFIKRTKVYAKKYFEFVQK